MQKRIRIAKKVNNTKRDNFIRNDKKPYFSKSLNSPFDKILHLQKALGNQAVQDLFESSAVQAKLNIWPSGNIYEKEAEKMAEKILYLPELRVQKQKIEKKEEQSQIKPFVPQFTNLIQNQTEEEIKGFPQTKSYKGKIQGVIPSIESSINSLKGKGQPMPKSVRNYFESRFGFDFSQVQMHTDTKAAETAKSINAMAFTVGREIFFGPGQYSPETSKGKQLLAHELTHTVQQKGGLVIDGGISEISKGRGDLRNVVFCRKQPSSYRSSRGETKMKLDRGNLIFRLFNFNINQYKLKPRHQAVLKLISRLIQKWKISLVYVVGHASKPGSTGWNKRLSEKRALKVATKLLKFGVKYNQIRLYGKGESAATGKRRYDRAVEVILIQVPTRLLKSPTQQRRLQSQCARQLKTVDWNKFFNRLRIWCLSYRFQFLRWSPPTGTQKSVESKIEKCIVNEAYKNIRHDVCKSITRKEIKLILREIRRRYRLWKRQRLKRRTS